MECTSGDSANYKKVIDALEERINELEAKVNTLENDMGMRVYAWMNAKFDTIVHTFNEQSSAIEENLKRLDNNSEVFWPQLEENRRQIKTVEAVREKMEVGPPCLGIQDLNCAWSPLSRPRIGSPELMRHHCAPTNHSLDTAIVIHPTRPSDPNASPSPNHSVHADRALICPADSTSPTAPDLFRKPVGTVGLGVTVNKELSPSTNLINPSPNNSRLDVTNASLNTTFLPIRTTLWLRK
ncbi:hypothetical protein H0H81_003586 [Sphagnurus paluster]|uniref:Uncharacterized protein n=1 Tax=Sphagnurus paluster TaxID=117069 RepID=A0A9P7FLT6_9AGAR|nr:hypothetical protein H0H81_003586 [Sphagnurus paluster]